MLYKEWLSEWLECYVKESVKERTHEKYTDIVRTRLIPVWGEYELDELTPLIVQKYIVELSKSGNVKTGEGLSANTVWLIIAVIQGSLKTAYSLGITDKYNMDKIKRPKANEKQISCFSPSEQKIIEQAALSDRRRKMLGILICLYAGLRVGELLALEWTDIDFTKNELTVRCKLGRLLHYEYSLFGLILYKQNTIISAAGSCVSPVFYTLSTSVHEVFRLVLFLHKGHGDHLFKRTSAVRFLVFLSVTCMYPQ